ncbi:MAG: outer membrane beta-barrel domain-containing protein [Sandaracinaceae bacterium]
MTRADIARWALALALATAATGPASAWAQDDADMVFGEEESGDEGADMDFAGAGDDTGGDTDMDFTDEGAAGAEEGAPTGDDALFEDLATPEGPVEDAVDEGPRRRVVDETIFAVQRLYALRINRVELIPSVAFSLNAPFVSRTAVSLGLNYWFTNVLAIGANFLWYDGLESETNLNFLVRRSTRLAVPINEYQFGTHLNFTYVPLYGKFAAFNEFIFQWDAYVVGGVGIQRTRPIPVIDPEVRTFDWSVRVAFNLGVGIRVFLTRWLSIFGEIRNYMYLEQLEALDVALGQDRFDPETWTQDSPAFTSNVTVHLGLTFFFPFEFEYRLPR